MAGKYQTSSKEIHSGVRRYTEIPINSATLIWLAHIGLNAISWQRRIASKYRQLCFKSIDELWTSAVLPATRFYIWFNFFFRASKQRSSISFVDQSHRLHINLRHSDWNCCNFEFFCWPTYLVACTSSWMNMCLWQFQIHCWPIRLKLHQFTATIWYPDIYPDFFSLKKMPPHTNRLWHDSFANRNVTDFSATTILLSKCIDNGNFRSWTEARKVNSKPKCDLSLLKTAHLKKNLSNEQCSVYSDALPASHVSRSLWHILPQSQSQLPFRWRGSNFPPFWGLQTAAIPRLPNRRNWRLSWQPALSKRRNPLRRIS